MREKDAYIVTVYGQNEILWIGVTNTIKHAFEIASFRGELQEPNRSYKSLTRCFALLPEARLWDKKRFGSEDEARRSGKASYVHIRLVKFFK